MNINDGRAALRKAEQAFGDIGSMLIAKDAEINTPFTKFITKGGKNVSTTMKKHEAVSSHVARRSFATNAYKRKIEPLLIMAITGHKTETEFLKYIKVTDEEKAAMFESAAHW